MITWSNSRWWLQAQGAARVKGQSYLREGYNLGQLCAVEQRLKARTCQDMNGKSAIENFEGIKLMQDSGMGRKPV